MPPKKKRLSRKKEVVETAVEAEPTLPIFTESPRERSAKRLMWLGVISFSAIIFALWGWSAMVQISGLEWNKAPEASLASKTKQDWNEIFTKQKEDATSRESAMQSIRDAIKGLNALTATSSTQITSSTNSTTTIK